MPKAAGFGAGCADQGYCMLEYPTHAEALAALSAMDGKEMTLGTAVGEPEIEEGEADGSLLAL